MAEFDPDAFLAKKEKRGGFDPDAFLAKTAPQPSAQSILGGTESSASKVASRAALADTLINAVSGTWDLAARIPATAYHYATGPKGESFGQAYERAAEEVARTAPIKPDLVGRTLGITNTPQYSGALQRRAAEAIAPVIQENAIQPVAEFTGLPEGAVADIGAIVSMPLAGPAGRGVAATGRAVKATAQVPVDVAKGALGRATGYIAEPGVAPQGYQVPSSRIPLGDTFIPAKEMAELQRGMPISEGAVRPISELAPAPVLALSGGEIPVAGRAAQAYGERLGETYRNPLTAAADIGSMFLTGGVPVLTAGRGALGLAQAGADAYLARKGFTGLTPEQTTALNQGTNPFYTAGPVAPKAQPAAVAPAVTTQAVEPQPLPQLTYNPTQPVMYASETGVVGKSPQAVVEADLAQRYAPQPVAPVAPQTVTAPVIDTAAEQAASHARKLQLLDQIRARTAPKTETPAVTVEPVAPVELPTTTASPMEQLFGIKTPSEELLAAIPEMANKTMPEIRMDIRNTGKAAINTKNNIVQLDKTVYDDLAAMHGAKLDWSTLGELKKGAADAREQVNKFVETAIKDVRGPEKRGPQQRTLQKQAEAEEAARVAKLSPEERAIEAARDAEITKNLAERQRKLGIGTTNAPQSTGVSSSLQAALDRAKAQGKYKPPGVMEMITNEPKAADKIRKAEWSTLDDYNQEIFMKTLGKNSNKEFIAKARTPEGSIIRAVDKKLDSEAIQYKTGDGFMTRRVLGTDEVNYSIFDKDGIQYDIRKTGDNIDGIEVRQGENVIAEYYQPPFANSAQWVVMERGPEGGQMISRGNLGVSKDPKTRNLLNELPNIDFNYVIEQNIARANDLKRVK